MSELPYSVRDSDGSMWYRKGDDNNYQLRHPDGRWSGRWDDYTLEEIRQDFGILSTQN